MSEVRRAMIGGPTALDGGLGRRVAAGAGWSLAARVTVSVLALVASAILTRLLPAEQMGHYLLATSVVAAAAVLASAGVNQLCIRYVAEHLAAGEPGLARLALRTLLRWGTVLVAASTFAFAALAYALSGTRASTPGAVLLAVLACWIFVSAVQALITDSLRGLRDLRAASLYGGPLTIGLVVLGLLVVVSSGASLTMGQAIMLGLAAAAANVCLAGVVLRRRVISMPLTTGTLARLRVTNVLAVSLPLVSTTALLLIFAAADLWVLGALQQADAVATYGVAARTAALVGMPLLVIYGVLSPHIAALHGRGEPERLHSLMQIAAGAASVPAAILTAVFISAGGPLLATVYGEHYRDGAFALAVLSAGQLASVVAGVCGLVLAMTGHQGVLLKITAVAVMTTVALLVLTIPVWGTRAAAVVAAGGLAAHNLAMVVAVRRLLGVSTVAAPIAMARALRGMLR